MSENEYLNKKRKKEENEEEKGKMSENKNEKENKIKDNIIIGNIKVEKNNLKERIINSFENAKNEFYKLRGIENEKEIKECEIFINDKKINFNYYYEFENEGYYTIKYIFKKLLKSTNYMFYDCESLISLDLSNFNTKNVTNMNFMFSNCSLLISLDLSNFNTQKVINKSLIFFIIIH